MLKIGHRGAMAYEPENTIKSFQKAIDQKVDMVELDVHNCKTGEIFVIHDETLERTTNGTGEISKKSFKELKSLLINNKEKIPTLIEVLNLAINKVQVNIELKGKRTEKTVLALIEKYINEKKFTYNDILISSFDYKKLKYIRKKNNNIKIGVLVKKDSSKIWKIAKKLNAWSINVSVKIIDEDLKNKAHEENLKVLTWTVNEYEDISKIKKLNVDGIFSNYPDRL